MGFNAFSQVFGIRGMVPCERKHRVEGNPASDAVIAMTDIRTVRIDSQQDPGFVNPDLSNNFLAELIVILESLVGQPQENYIGETVGPASVQRFDLPCLRQVLGLYRAVAGPPVAISTYDQDDLLALCTPTGDCSPGRRFLIVGVRGHNKY